MYIDIFEIVPDNVTPRRECYNCSDCPHLVAVHVDSSHNAYIECDINIEDILKLCNNRRGNE